MDFIRYMKVMESALINAILHLSGGLIVVNVIQAAIGWGFMFAGIPDGVGFFGYMNILNAILVGSFLLLAACLFFVCKLRKVERFKDVRVSMLETNRKIKFIQKLAKMPLSDTSKYYEELVKFAQEKQGEPEGHEYEKAVHICDITFRFIHGWEWIRARDENRKQYTDNQN